MIQVRRIEAPRKPIQITCMVIARGDGLALRRQGVNWACETLVTGTANRTNQDLCPAEEKQRHGDEAPSGGSWNGGAQAIGLAVVINVYGVVAAGAEVVAVRDSIAVGVVVRHSAAAEAGIAFIRIEWARVYIAIREAIRDTIHICIYVGHTAAADSRENFVRIERALVEAAIDIWRSTTADAGGSFQGIKRAEVVAIGCAITIAIRVGHTTSANSRSNLIRVNVAFIDAVWGAIAVGVGI